MILNLKDPSECTRKYLDKINTFNKAVRKKASQQKWKASLYANSKFTEKEIGGNILVTKALKIILRTKSNQWGERRTLQWKFQTLKEKKN